MKKVALCRMTELLVLLVATVTCLTACSAQMDIGATDDMTVDFLNLLLADDHDGAYALMAEEIEPSDFDLYWDALRKLCDGATDYEIEQVGWNINIKNGTTSRSASFEVCLNNGRYLLVRTTLVEGFHGIYHIAFDDTTEFITTYVPRAHTANIILLGWSLLTIAFTVWMIVDCARRKIARKPLWIVLILLGLSLSISFGKRFAINFGLGIFISLSGAEADPSILSVTARLLIPVGAIVYFFMRKRLTVTPPREQFMIDV